MQNSIYDVIVVGGGAAGLMAAAILSRRQKKTLLMEHNASLGKKILISGGGRCNFTNIHTSAQDYLCQNPHFVKSALSQFTSHDFIQWVNAANIPFYEKKLGQLFCKNTARDIVDLLLNKIDRRCIDIALSMHIEKINHQDNDFIVHTQDQHSFTGKALIVACGGLSFEKLGASDLGYRLAKHFGHDLIPPQPALDGFALNPIDLNAFQALAGVSLPVKISIDDYVIADDLLFTHNGLSGPAALKASLYWQKQQPLVINYAPWTNKKELFDFFTHQKQCSGHKTLKSVLKSKFPARFLECFLPSVHFNKKTAELSTQTLQFISNLICAYAITPKSTIGYHKAEVTKGGVSTEFISSKTMQSKLCPGLFFIGEVLDVTGQLGGYNFQWAWSSGYVAGQNA